MPGFGRIAAPDTRDRAYPMRAAMRAMPLKRFRTYNIGRQLPLDQGDTGTCVAHAWTGFLLASPLQCRNAMTPFDLYRGLVLKDEFPENDIEASYPNDQLQYGSSVRGGAKYLVERGYVKSYVWAESADDMARWILGDRGTVVMGTNWYWDMSTPRPKDEVVELSGGIAGGHAWLVVGYNAITRLFRCLNSWGSAFGEGGRFTVRHDDMDRLIHEDGEACAAVEQLVTPVMPV